MCELKSTFLQHREGPELVRKPWGSGEQIKISAFSGQPNHDGFYFFDEDNILIGAVFRFFNGLSLKPYPVLRQTLSQLPPSLRFYMDTSALLRGGEVETAVLYRTGDATSTTRYVILESKEGPDLLLATMALDPYEPLLADLQKSFLSGENERSPNPKDRNQHDQKTLEGLQQFARGETAWFASCKVQRTDIAIDGYRKAIHEGLSDQARLAEAHHKLGLALKEKGDLEEAQKEVNQALVMTPNNPTMINSLGTILAQQGNRSEAIKMFDRAIVLMPNYARARFNLAEAIESVNARRAIEEYETFIALVEGIPEEEARSIEAQHRVERLKSQ